MLTLSKGIKWRKSLNLHIERVCNPIGKQSNWENRKILQFKALMVSFQKPTTKIIKIKLNKFSEVNKNEGISNFLFVILLWEKMFENSAVMTEQTWKAIHTLSQFFHIPLSLFHFCFQSLPSRLIFCTQKSQFSEGGLIATKGGGDRKTMSIFFANVIVDVVVVVVFFFLVITSIFTFVSGLMVWNYLNHLF